MSQKLLRTLSVASGVGDKQPASADPAVKPAAVKPAAVKQVAPEAAVKPAGIGNSGDVEAPGMQQMEPQTEQEKAEQEKKQAALLKEMVDAYWRAMPWYYKVPILGRLCMIYTSCCGYCEARLQMRALEGKPCGHCILRQHELVNHYTCTKILCSLFLAGIICLVIGAVRCGQTSCVSPMLPYLVVAGLFSFFLFSPWCFVRCFGLSNPSPTWCDLCGIFGLMTAPAKPGCPFEPMPGDSQRQGDLLHLFVLDCTCCCCFSCCTLIPVVIILAVNSWE